MDEFNLHFGIKSIPENADVFIRRACKAVIKKDNTILLIHTNKGDYKFPGGGYKKGESLQECMTRELLEETGFSLLKINNLLGSVTEQRLDKGEEGKYFSMMSEYYNVLIDDTFSVSKNLDSYEKELDFKSVYVDINEAISTNEKVLQNKAEDCNPWVLRETCVLKELLKMF